MKRSLLFITITTIILAACSGNKQTKTKKFAEDSTTLRIGIVPTLDCVPFILAADSGIYDSLGLNVKFITYGSVIDCDTALWNSRINGCVIDLVHATMQNSKGKDIRLMMQTEGMWKLVTSKTARLRKIDDLKERLVAITRHSATDYLSDDVLKGTKMEHDDIFRPQVNSMITRTQMLIGNQIDAAFLEEPYASKAILLGNPSVYGSEDAGIQLNALCLNHNDVSKRAEDVRKLIKGYNIACEKINKGKTKAIAGILNSKCKIEKEIIDTMAIHSFHKAKSVHSEDLKKVETWAKNYKLIPANHTSTGIIDSHFIE